MTAPHPVAGSAERRRRRPGATTPSLSVALAASLVALGLISQILSFIDNFNRPQPEMVLAKPETLFSSVLMVPDLVGTTLDDVRQTLQLLETLGVLQRSNGEGYVSQTTLTGAKTLIEALAKMNSGEPASEEQATSGRDVAETAAPSI